MSQLKVLPTYSSICMQNATNLLVIRPSFLVNQSKNINIPEPCAPFRTSMTMPATKLEESLYFLLIVLSPELNEIPSMVDFHFRDFS